MQQRLYHQVAIFGASGALGAAFVKYITEHKLAPQGVIHAFSCQKLPAQAGVIHQQIDAYDDVQLAQAAESVHTPYDLIIIATGILHQEDITPEKSIRDLDVASSLAIYHSNTLIPMLIAKHFLPCLDTQKPGILMALTARVGSITDNRLGGWHSYRASKAALNMMIKNLAIEYNRFHKKAIIIGMHPGTVDSKLSRPFQRHVPQNQLFSPQVSVAHMMAVLDHVQIEDAGSVIAWDGEKIPS